MNNFGNEYLGNGNCFTDRKPEVLAPAGDLESLKVAVFSGADAVYFGLQAFNARSKAQNFTLENLGDVVDFCHLYGTKVYLTVNTLIKDSELNEVLELVKSAYQKHVDAFIIQDLGLARVLKRNIPDIELHASTQMGIHNLEGALIAEEMGFKRIVLSREVTLNDISLIKAWTNLEVEYFVQGALCVSFSGNCYFSALKFNKSGNRGACLQPCRLKYRSSARGEYKYLLSPRDLCLINRLKQLADIGVDSFKIEGRMRRPAYVAQAVQSYRNAIDSDYNEDVCKFEENNLKRIFSRGEFNEGVYLDSIREQNIINKEFQNHRGMSIGQVAKVERFKDIFAVMIETKRAINNGDGLKFIDEGGDELSIGVGGVEKVSDKLYRVYTKRSPNIGDTVYKTVDFNYESQLVSVARKLPIDAHFEAYPEETAKLTLSCGQISAKCESMFVCDTAQNQALTKERTLQNIDRFNDTPFELKNLTCDLGNVFIPASRLNELRRMCVDALYREIVKTHEKPTRKLVKDSVKPLKLEEKNTQNFAIIESATQIGEVDAETNVIFAPRTYDLEQIKDCLLAGNENGHSFIYLNLPNVANSHDIQRIKTLLTEMGQENVGIVANNLYALCFSKLGFKTIVGYQMNVTNMYTAQVLFDRGAEAFVKSIESDLSCELEIGHNYVGKPTLMTFCHCPYKTVYDYNACNDCDFHDGLYYQSEDYNSYYIRRTQCASCYFDLVFNEKIGQPTGCDVIDLREY